MCITGCYYIDDHNDPLQQPTYTHTTTTLPLTTSTHTPTALALTTYTHTTTVLNNHPPSSPVQEVQGMGADACGPVYEKLECTWRAIVKLHETPDDTALDTARPRKTDARYNRAYGCPDWLFSYFQIDMPM